MRFLFLLSLALITSNVFADYKCSVELFSQNNLQQSVGKYTIFGLENGYHSPTEIALLVESDDGESMSTIMFYHIMDTEEGENNLSLSLVRQTVFWNVNRDYNHTKYKNLGRLLLNGTSESHLNFENYHIRVNCLIK